MHKSAASHGWLEQLVTRTVPLSEWTKGLDKGPDDIKVVVDLQD